MNTKQALGLAASSPLTLASQVSTALSAHTLNFTGISAMFTFDPQGCSNLSLGQVSVDFDVLDATIATCAGTQVHPGEQVFENPGLTSVVGVATDNKTGGCSGGGSVLSSSTAGSGPSAVDSSATSARELLHERHLGRIPGQLPRIRYQMKYVTTYFSQPEVSKNSDCRERPPRPMHPGRVDRVGYWEGLHRGQDGTAANVYRSSRSCNAPQYSAWWEFYGYDALQTCSPQGSYPVRAGDSIEAIAENGVNTPGGYDLLVVDTSANPAWVCDSGVHDFSYQPTYAETILRDQPSPAERRTCPPSAPSRSTATYIACGGTEAVSTTTIRTRTGPTLPSACRTALPATT